MFKENTRYELEKYDEIHSWWLEHQDYDINEFEDYITISKRDNQIMLEHLRNVRKDLLNAFDIYKSNVAYGIESDENHSLIIAWYRDILELDEEAINNVPDEIKKYL